MERVETFEFNGYTVPHVLKPEGLHHPHGIDDTSAVIDFVTK